MRTLFAGTHAVFEGSLYLRLAMEGGRDAEVEAMPFVVVLRVAGHQVIEHLDLADYQPFLEALRLARAGRGS